MIARDLIRICFGRNDDKPLLTTTLIIPVCPVGIPGTTRTGEAHI